jgi:hypothetical protein
MGKKTNLWDSSVKKRTSSQKKKIDLFLFLFIQLFLDTFLLVSIKVSKKSFSGQKLKKNHLHAIRGIFKSIFFGSSQDLHFSGFISTTRWISEETMRKSLIYKSSPLTSYGPTYLTPSYTSFISMLSTPFLFFS